MKNTYQGKPYHLWHPSTRMGTFLLSMDIGPVLITRGQGPFVFNSRGERFINGMSSLWNVAVGHGREELVQAAAAQMRELAFASSFRQAHPAAIELADRLIGITSDNYAHVFLSVNGSDAVEAALMMARQYHRQSPHKNDRSRYKILSLRGSYHGASFGAKSAAGADRNELKNGPLVPGFLQIDPPYCYRCQHHVDDGHATCSIQCAEALESAILKEGPETVAAFIIEPVMGAFGIVEPPEGYHQKTSEICRRYGVIHIADEVTTGFGRTGRLFYSSDWPVQPDILCLGKAITSGYQPLAATLATEEIYSRFIGDDNFFDYGPTASGHPVACAVALKNIEIILGEDLAANARSVGEYLKSRLQDLAADNKVVGDVRGSGLMLGIELVKNRKTKEPLRQKKTLYILADTAISGLIVYNNNKNVLGLFPPLITDMALADEMIDILDRTLATGIKADAARAVRLARGIASSMTKARKRGYLKERLL